MAQGNSLRPILGQRIRKFNYYTPEPEFAVSRDTNEPIHAICCNSHRDKTPIKEGRKTVFRALV